MPQITRPPQHERAAFGRRLRSAMDRAGATRTDLATALGVHYNTVGSWLRAEADCPVGWIGPLATALEVPVQDLVNEPEMLNITATSESVLAKRVVEVLRGPLSAPDLMELLAEAQMHVA